MTSVTSTGRAQPTDHRRSALRVLLLFAIAITLIGGGIVLFDAAPWVRGPGPYPPSWRWLYIPLGIERLNRLLPYSAFLFLYFLFAIRQSRPGARHRVGILGAMIFLFIWQLLQTWVREENLLDTMIFRTYAPPLNGYFVAPAQVESIAGTLHNYLASMPDFFADKAKTHPPGLFLFYAAFQILFEHLAGFSSRFAPIAREWAIEGRDWPLLVDPLVTSAFFTSWIQVGIVSLTPLSAYLLTSQLRQPDPERKGETALWAALAIPLVPPITGFFLQWDTLYAGLILLAWYFALRGQNRLADLHYSGSGQWSDWIWAGLLLSVLTWLSFGNAVAGLLIGGHVLWRESAAYLEHRNRFDPILMLPIAAGLGLMGLAVALPWILASLFWNMNFFALLASAMDSHFELVTAARDPRLWRWMNGIDFALWFGPGTLLLGLGGTFALVLRSWQNHLWRDWGGMALIFWTVLLLLNLSGTTRGEIGRLWTFLMPYPLLFALVLPWRRAQYLVILLLMMVWSWVLTYSIAPMLCC